MSTPKELMDMTLQAYEQFEDDKAKHCQLIEVSYVQTTVLGF